MHLSEAAASFALVGNPNTGKTTLFNALTGLSHRVGNYPGVTVERLEGDLKLGGRTVSLIDLPGTYSLAARSQDEAIAVDVMLGQHAGELSVKAILAILDANNIKRNLYLLSQLMELGHPLVVALNMSDVARRHGIEIDAAALSQRLGIPVIPTSSDRGEGVDEVRRALGEALENRGSHPARGAQLPQELVRQVDALQAYLLSEEATLKRKVAWAEALRILVDVEGEFEKRLLRELGVAFLGRLAAFRRDVESERPLHALEAVARYGWIDEIADACVRRPSEMARTKTDRIDGFFTHRVWGTLALLLILGGIFQAIYSWSAPLMEAIDGFFGVVAGQVSSLIPPGPLQSLIVDGVIRGAGAVVIFLPQILVLVFFIALLEDCGYMARAAFLADKLFVRLGLSGRSVIPLLSSFACAVPGIMAARAIDSRRNRLATILVAPLMSCSARLPVYVLLIGAFVPGRSLLGGWLGLQGLVLLLAHLIGITVAIPVLLIVKKTVLRGPNSPFVMELPPYRVPVLRNVLSRLIDQSRAFLVNAGTVIFSVSVVIWALSYFPHPASIHQDFEAQRAAQGSPAERLLLDQQEASAYLSQSVLGRFGQVVEPVVEPLGWDWRIGMAVVGSFAAREIVIATLGTIFSVGSDVDEGSETLLGVIKSATWPDGRKLFNLPVALSLIVFFALCCQCVATLAVMKRETASWRWPAYTFAYMTVLAYLAAMATYQLGMRLVA